MEQSDKSNSELGKRGISRRSMLKTGAATGAGLALSSRMGSAVFAQDATAVATSNGAAKSVIFMMGDGMGQAHRDFGQWVTVGAYDQLVMNTLPVVGMQGTNCVSPDAPSLIPEPGASATAF